MISDGLDLLSSSYHDRLSKLSIISFQEKPFTIPAVELTEDEGGGLWKSASHGRAFYVGFNRGVVSKEDFFAFCSGDPVRPLEQSFCTASLPLENGGYAQYYIGPRNPFKDIDQLNSDIQSFAQSISEKESVK